MPRRKNVVPLITLHKPTGQSRVRFEGRSYYLGPHESKEAAKAYAHLFCWLQATSDPPKNWRDLEPGQLHQSPPGMARVGITVSEIMAKY